MPPFLPPILIPPSSTSNPPRLARVLSSQPPITAILRPVQRFATVSARKGAWIGSAYHGVALGVLYWSL